MKRRIYQVVMLSVFLFSGSILYAQSITGTVADSMGTLPGVNIMLEGTQMGSTTDMEGNFEITNVPNGTYTLIASFIGYVSYTKKITLEGNNLVENIVLKEDALMLDDVVVTGVVNPQSRIESSISVTSLKPGKITQSAPRSTAEIFRTIPGIRSESSGGEGNANIAVRGVPISSGGSKYVQLQEDGLPVLLYGDISFATADMFTRFDSNIARIEAIRGGSASTLSSNSPGGIINIISKTGRNEGGAISTTFGLDYESFRTDVDYGGKITEDLYFHVGGFYRLGEGVRKAGYTANNGGQIKFNLTKEFENGHIRIYTKFLDDRAAAYMPMPMKVTGTNSDPDWGNLANYDATTGALQTPYLTQNLGLGSDGSLRRSSVSDGMHVKTQSVGIEFEFNLPGDWKVKNNGRYSANSGGFIAPFPSGVGTASAMAETIGGAGATLSYANGDGAVNSDALVNNIVLFDTPLNNLNNFMNDFRLSKKFNKVSFTLGYFKSFQNLSTSWLWSSFLQEVSDDNARLLNVTNAAGTLLSSNGQYLYGSPWGALHRNYDTKYNVSAPYVNFSIEAAEGLTFDGGVRYDLGKVEGSFSGGSTKEYDIDGNGVISDMEKEVHFVDNTNATIVDYDYDYWSYTFGANYKFSSAQSVFARYSRGASAKADRILFSSLDYLDGDKINAKDFISQVELGYKQRLDRGAVYATAFYANTKEEGGYEATSNSIIENDYRSFGLELEAFYSFENFDLRGALTYTNAEITSGDNKGNTPRRQPDFIYNFLPSYNFGVEKQHSIGLSFVGQTKAYSQDSNELVMPGFMMVNGFVNIGITEGLSMNLAANNIFDSIGVTEAEEGRITDNNTVNYVRARALPGRSISLTLRYKF